MASPTTSSGSSDVDVASAVDERILGMSDNVSHRLTTRLIEATDVSNVTTEEEPKMQCGQITPHLALKVLLQFDKAINNALANRVKTRLTFKAGHLSTYRFCDNVWTFVLKDVEFREVQELVKADKVKIVACDGKSPRDHGIIELAFTLCKAAAGHYGQALGHRTGWLTSILYPARSYLTGGQRVLTHGDTVNSEKCSRSLDTKCTNSTEDAAGDSSPEDRQSRQ
ncbi:hypothetical protein HPB47_028216 [Ixodes persulcatus]|uniref:Uncharacterized protein n=1 Tax=Ixodes persulcatus TaxID=34615 RepID=A0AC60PVL9_IXOPE|nr:hypothetical protein HPB47_028216 [Ixodes persulcatus]